MVRILKDSIQGEVLSHKLLSSHVLSECFLILTRISSSSRAEVHKGHLTIMTQIPEAHSCTCRYEICQAHVPRRHFWASPDCHSGSEAGLPPSQLSLQCAESEWQGDRVERSHLHCAAVGRGSQKSLNLRPHPNNSASHAQSGSC